MNSTEEERVAWDTGKPGRPGLQRLWGHNYSFHFPRGQEEVIGRLFEGLSMTYILKRLFCPLSWQGGRRTGVEIGKLVLGYFSSPESRRIRVGPGIHWQWGWNMEGKLDLEGRIARYIDELKWLFMWVWAHTVRTGSRVVLKLILLSFRWETVKGQEGFGWNKWTKACAKSRKAFWSL